MWREASFIPAQAILEFIAVVRRRQRTELPLAIEVVRDWMLVYEIVPTTEATMSEAIRIYRVHDLQIWDSVILAAAQSAGAALLWTEDLQHSFRLGDLEVRNPFAPNAAALPPSLPE